MQRPSQLEVLAPEWVNLPQLNAARTGTRVLFATDEWFAEAGNLNREEPPTFDEDAFDTHGKVMDGWESRRKRTAGHDWCLMKLGLPGVVVGFEVDTSFFTGNQVPRISIQGANIQGDLAIAPWDAKGTRKGTKASDEEVAEANALGSKQWEELVPMSPLKPGYADTCRHWFAVSSTVKVTHLRINYWPDGGVARLRCFGRVQKDWSTYQGGQLVDLAATVNGGLGLMASNSHYGRPQNMLSTGPSVNMGDGWETARNPNRPPEFKLTPEGMMELPGFDWCCIQLGTPGVVTIAEVDTMHFEGNYPESCLIEGALVAPGAPFNPDQATWTTLLPRTRLTANSAHKFDKLLSAAAVSHVRLSIYPDGGVARLRFWGTPSTKSNL
ncbi:allantoicase [Baffinella frigidus]|nr:allantoicase [Cryptophyta sp. CCMP2293]